MLQDFLDVLPYNLKNVKVDGTGGDETAKFGETTVATLEKKI